jgi:hypothetical protein
MKMMTQNIFGFRSPAARYLSHTLAFCRPAAAAMLEGAPRALSFLYMQAPLYAELCRRVPHARSLFSVSKHPFTLSYVGGGPMRGCLLLAVV